VVLLYVSGVGDLCPVSLSLRLLCSISGRASGDASGDRTALLAGVQYAQNRSYCANQTAGRQFEQSLRAALVEKKSPSSGFILDCCMPRCVSGCWVGLI
jgi:hypothetical protein